MSEQLMMTFIFGLIPDEVLFCSEVGLCHEIVSE